MLLNCQDIDKNNSEINRRKAQIQTDQKTLKKLTKEIEESKNEKERLDKEMAKFSDIFNHITETAFIVKEKYEAVQKVCFCPYFYAPG